jgi:hypothetical protein
LEPLLAAQGSQLIRNGLKGEYNPTITKLLLTKHSYTDRQDITSGGKPLLVSPKQHEARKQALKDGVPEARAEGHRS